MTGMRSAVVMAGGLTVIILLMIVVVVRRFSLPQVVWIIGRVRARLMLESITTCLSVVGTMRTSLLFQSSVLALHTLLCVVLIRTIRLILTGFVFQNALQLPLLRLFQPLLRLFQPLLLLCLLSVLML